MIVQLLIVMGVDVAAREEGFNMLQKFRIDRHHVFEMSVRRAILDHPYLAIAFDDLSFDLADVLVDQRRNLAVAAENLLTSFDHAVRAKRIRLSRES